MTLTLPLRGRPTISLPPTFFHRTLSCLTFHSSTYSLIFWWGCFLPWCWESWLWQFTHLQCDPQGRPAWKHSQYFFWHLEFLQEQIPPATMASVVPFSCVLLVYLFLIESLISWLSTVFTQSTHPHRAGSQGNPFLRQSQYPCVQLFLWQLHLNFLSVCYCYWLC